MTETDTLKIWQLYSLTVWQSDSVTVRESDIFIVWNSGTLTVWQSDLADEVPGESYGQFSHCVEEPGEQGV